WLEDIIFKLLRKNPSERFQTGEEVLKALQQGEAGQATRFAPVIHPAKPTAGRKSNKKTKKKLPLAWVLVSSLAVFSLIVSAYALTREQSVMEDDSGVAARVPTKERYQSNERSQRRQLASDDESRQSRLQLPTQSPSFFIVENGAVVAELTTLEDAIEESNDGGVIEIRTNETIEVSHVFIETPSLTIAAGAEFRPTLKFVGVPDENDDEARFLMEGDLTLEGLRLIDLDSSGEDGTMLRVLDGSFSATNCEFRSLGTCLEFTDCDGVEIDGCELHSSDRTAVAFLNDQEAEIQMSNSTVSGNVAIWIELGRSTRFTMNQCAIVAPEIFNVWVSDELDFDDLELDELATLSLHDSLLVSQLGTFCFDEPDSESQLFDEWTRWNGNGNVFSGPIRHVESFRFGASEQEDVWIRKFGGKNPQLITDPFEAGEDLWSLRDQPSFQLKKLKFNSELRDAALRAIARAGLPFET
ncbi:MAG: right-handed parallel beta-helix repeat-containing protein, partial [Planctomycetota bacterium]